MRVALLALLLPLAVFAAAPPKKEEDRRSGFTDRLLETDLADFSGELPALIDVS